MAAVLTAEGSWACPGTESDGEISMVERRPECCGLT